MNRMRRKVGPPATVVTARAKRPFKVNAASSRLKSPRDRNGSFEPQRVKKRQRRLEGFDDKLLALYARGLSTREIQAQLEELYGVEVSPALTSNVTAAVHEEVKAWTKPPAVGPLPDSLL